MGTQTTTQDVPERTDYFHKYVVASVAEHDGVAGTLAVETSYEYLGGAAWHWDTSEVTPQERKTWSEFRGFSGVRIRTGSGNDGPKTMVERRFYRGMDGDRLPSGTRSAAVADSEGDTRTDAEWLRGFEFESATFEHEAASVSDTSPRRVTKTITDPVVHGPTATRGSLHVYLVRAGVEREFTALAAGGARVTRTETTYDDMWGLPTAVNDLGDTVTAADDLCTITTYRPNQATWLIDYPSRVETVSLRCGQPPSYPEDAVGDTLTYYDGQDDDSPPTTGNATTVKVAAEHPAAGPSYVVDARSTYDARGRAALPPRRSPTPAGEPRGCASTARRASTRRATRTHRPGSWPR